MSKHTRGPWLISDDGTIEAKHLGLVGHIKNASAADLAIIAAAPELLEACKELVTRCGPNAEDGKRARAAIAKAEGRADD
jgi:acylphosphatase